MDPTHTNVILVVVVSPATVAIYRSTDGGAAFSSTGILAQHATPDWSPTIADAVAFEPGASPPVAAAAGPSVGVLLSSDDGASWASAQGNAVTQMFTGLAFSGGNLYVSTLGEGVLKAHVPRFWFRLSRELAAGLRLRGASARSSSRAWSLSCCIWASRSRSARSLLIHSW